MRDIFSDYLKQLPQPVTPAVAGRITIVGSNPQ
jgi:hypothetical protein